MIARLWHGWTDPGDADAYEVEFLTDLRFESPAAVRQFAGEDYERSPSPPERRAESPSSPRVLFGVMIRRCEDHGYVEGSCPACGESGRRVLREDRRVRLSKFLSGALRHFPGDAGLSLDGQGWADYDALVDAATGQYDWATAEHVAAVIATDPKGRFERRGDRVRAAYGHSIDVDVDLEPAGAEVPDRLYHGTAPGTLDAIAAEGLRPMGRQRVHLSATRATAREVGRRHADGEPAVLAVDAAALERDGVRVDRRGDDTYTVERVPPAYLEVIDDGR